MKRNLLLISGLFLGALTFAQQGDGGIPRTQKMVSIPNTIEHRMFAQPDIEALQKEDAINDELKTGPWRFGFNNETNLNMNNSGTWTDLSNGGKIWQLALTCENALTVNLTLEDVAIPEGNELYVFNPQKDFILGKFVQRHVYEGQLGTELVPGNTVIVEYYVTPENVNIERGLTVATVTHGYRKAQEFMNKAFGSSGSCNMNSICPEGVPWTNQIRSALMLVSGSNGFCSGAMINNTQNDGTPYVLTANHCYSNPASWIFRFNWASPTCSNPASSPTFQSLSGAVLRSRRTPSDFALVEITGGLVNGTVPLAYNTYFPGWDNSGTNPTSTMCVHHPAGDIKKISFDQDASSPVQAMGSSEPNSSWQVQWDLNTTTEGGSSGSPLFDQNGRIIGQLWGGGASCWNLSAPDYYGRVSSSWEPSGSNSTNQLKHWLDPNDAGVPTVDGFDPQVPPCNSTYSHTTTEDNCFGENNGQIDVSFLTGNSSGATFNIGNGTQSTGLFTGLSQGAYTIEVIDGDGCSTSINVTLGGPTALTTSGGTQSETVPGNGAINLSAYGGNSPYTYAWTGPNGFTSADEDLTGLVGGDYSVTVTDNSGCTTTANFTVNSLVSVENLTGIQFGLYPNPSDGIFNITMDNVDQFEYTISVTDVAGRVVYGSSMDENLHQVDLSEMENGTYLLHIANDHNKVTRRIVLRR